MAPKTRAEISAELDLFSVQTVSVLVDDMTQPDMIRSIPDAGVEGYYTFTAAMAGRTVRDHKIRLLPLAGKLSDSEAWLIATDSKAGHALNAFLRERHQEERIIFTLANSHVAHIYSYVDFFHGETATVAYVSNTFERGYKIHLPVAIRYLLRSQSGAVRKSGQWIIAPNQTIAFDSRTIGLEEAFTGVLELYADVRHLNGEITEFFHFHCDYLSAAGVATIHQSGFQPWPAGTRFVRGIVPTDNQNQLTVSLFNRKNERPIACTAVLRRSRGGQRLTATKDLPAIAAGNLVLVNINDLFATELADGAEDADVLIVPDAPMHRPNFYHHASGSRAWTAVEHAAGLRRQTASQGKLADIGRLKAHSQICAVPILPEAFGLESTILYLEEGRSPRQEFRFEVHDEAGRRRLETNVHCPFGQRLNIQDWLGSRSLSLEQGGLLKISPLAGGPKSFSFLQGMKRRGAQGMPSTVICAGGLLNLPFEWERSCAWDHPALPIVHTEQFGKAVVNEEFDTIVTLMNASAMYAYDGVAEVEFWIYAADGKMAAFPKTIAPNATLTFSVGELLKSSNLPDQGYFTLWVYCRNRFVQGFHILQRRQDGAAGIQHFYYCRLNSVENDLPFQREIGKTFHG